MTSQPGTPPLFSGRDIAPSPLCGLQPPLPTRLTGILERAGVATVTELVAASDADLLDVRQIGPEGLATIRAVLASQHGQHPLDQIPLEDLHEALQARSFNVLKRAGFHTAEEVASVTNAVLLELPNVGPLTVQLIREATFHALAARHTAGRVMHQPGERARESIAIIAELAMCALERGDAVIHEQAQGLLQTLAPGFPQPDATRRPRGLPEYLRGRRHAPPPPLHLVRAGPRPAPP
ncbi:hypothetical protein GCM10029976_066540 [Kribbella albertanoniae]|uniref:RNA polymerase alpha subunit C-terminal domain-containing protein n=1 Tax=Kribbella albertanoniae TaxID=1266829 RepID=A0A4R4QJF0_9ACTN|nr:DNA-directed RNA polymerase subunit alpha C-terminal domain-containing protein [Kribbella albertanoniae]TDC35770.1 hypothetical protein E1261_00125 [Kribbella albertanoniae]